MGKIVLICAGDGRSFLFQDPTSTPTLIPHMSVFCSTLHVQPFVCTSVTLYLYLTVCRSNLFLCPLVSLFVYQSVCQLVHTWLNFYYLSLPSCLSVCLRSIESSLRCTDTRQKNARFLIQRAIVSTNLEKSEPAFNYNEFLRSLLGSYNEISTL